MLCQIAHNVYEQNKDYFLFKNELDSYIYLTFKMINSQFTRLIVSIF